MNVATEGRQLWMGGLKEQAIVALSAALHVMLVKNVAVQADAAKVAELLADCHIESGSMDEALLTIRSVQPPRLSAIQYPSQRSSFEHRSEECGQERENMVEVLNWPHFAAAVPGSFLESLRKGSSAIELPRCFQDGRFRDEDA